MTNADSYDKPYLTAMDAYSDPRISNLPQWARKLIQDGYDARRINAHWRGLADKVRDEMDALRAEHAKTNGADTYDTWIVTGEQDGEPIRHGLGEGVGIEFGDPAELTASFTVTYREGGIDIDVDYTGYSIKPGAGLSGPTLRIE